MCYQIRVARCAAVCCELLTYQRNANLFVAMLLRLEAGDGMEICCVL